MNFLHITDLGNGQVGVAWQRGNAVPRHYKHPIPFTNPLTAQDRAELRWYMERYLSFPYGAERERAQKVERQMARWGEALFRQVFAKAGEDPDPRAFYQETVRSNGNAGRGGVRGRLAAGVPGPGAAPGRAARDCGATWVRIYLEGSGRIIAITEPGINRTRVDEEGVWN